MQRLLVWGLCFLSLFSCSRLEESEKEKIRLRNCKGELIYRSHKERFYKTDFVQHTPRTPYPWESELHFPRITKEFFRCKGRASSSSETREDCGGADAHGLPLISGKEGVYPILIDLLNYIQQQTRKRVVITCGHRCPIHNSYSDPSKGNRYSKHQIGAEVDFYVQGMEEMPFEIIALIMQYYKEMPSYKQATEYLDFERYHGNDTGTATPPWRNKEIYMKVFQAHEGRDEDNLHPYPYISLQVRFDSKSKERVLYSWDKAYKGYLRKR